MDCNTGVHTNDTRTRLDMIPPVSARRILCKINLWPLKQLYHGVLFVEKHAWRKTIKQIRTTWDSRIILLASVQRGAIWRRRKSYLKK